MSNQTITKKPKRKTTGRIVVLVMTFLLVATMITYLSIINQIHIRHSTINSNSNSFNPIGINSSSKDLKTLLERMRYLETKVDAHMAYGKDPFLSQKAPAKCKEEIAIKKIACPDNESCAVDNSVVCMDGFPFEVGGNDKSKNRKKEQQKSKKKDCVVYDFGIRESPQYGLAFAKQCDVVGFDPSPISIKWWDTNRKSIRKEYPSYSFSPVGAGGIDGDIMLREYDWGQVSIIQFPVRVINPDDCNTSGGCKYTFHKQQNEFSIPVRTLSTILAEHKHDRVHLLKLDVEGSEYSFLETMIDDLSCRRVDQLVLEWHHYDHDGRYGVTSNPQINVLVALLKERCGLEQFWVHGSQGWPSNQKIYHDMGMTLYYTLSSFKRTTSTFD